MVKLLPKGLEWLATYRSRKKFKKSELQPLFKELVMSSRPIVGALIVEGKNTIPKEFIGTPTEKTMNKPPTFGQMWKFCSEFCENITNLIIGPYNRHVPMKITKIMGTEDYLELIRMINIYNKSVERKNNAFVIKYGQKINDKLSNLVNQTSSARDYATYNQYRFGGLKVPEEILASVPKTIDVFNDLLALARNFPLLWDKVQKTVIVVTDPIIIVHPNDPTLRYNFGKFNLVLGKTGDRPVCNPHTPRLSKLTRYVHPHVQGGNRPCFGNGNGAFNRAIMQGRIFDSVDIAINILNTFGNHSINQLKEWDGVCDERFIPATGQIVPRDTKIDLGLKTVLCGLCNAQVNRNDFYQCHDHNCDIEACIGCMEKCSWDGCGNFVCEDHYFSCDTCGNRFCSDGGNSEHFSYSPYTCDACYENTEEEDQYEEELEDENTDEDNE